MSYEMHITRAASYLEDTQPIRLEEIEMLLETLPQGFSIDRSGVVTAVTPQGQWISVEVGPYLIYEDEKDAESRVHIYFKDETAPWFCVHKEKNMLPIIALAEMIHAKIQGDEEEVYTKESILMD